jgi:2-amino-4-hydroxy-6-hydroxymethyldihydropteridine diphosphokinase
VVEAIIALGSNLGDREGNLRRAVAAIGNEAKVLEASSVYETEPMYLENQGPFLNCVIAVETEVGPASLLKLLKSLEESMGREPTHARNGPRRIDLDILFYGSEVLSEPTLEIPHPGIAERAFVLVPLVEIRPRLIHPRTGATASEMLRDLKTEKKVVRRSDLSLGGPQSRTPRRGPPGRSPSRRAP